MTNQESIIKKEKGISFIQKCIILANILRDKNKHVVNAFDNIPFVRLYTSNIKDEKFVYSKIKGALMLIYEENDNQLNFFLQIHRWIMGYQLILQ